MTHEDTLILAAVILYLAGLLFAIGMAIRVNLDRRRRDRPPAGIRRG